jgi:hypothetical protein
MSMSKIDTYEKLRDAVEANGGVLTIPMGVLRDVHGMDRLGIHVRANISRELAGMGLAHYPRSLPDRQHAHARIYKQGSPVAKIVSAVLTVDPKTDGLLRKTAMASNDKILDKIRELLDEEE